MTGTMYLHHERTIVARWHDDDTPVLEGIDLLPPLSWQQPSGSLLATLSQATRDCRSVRVAVPTARTPVHRYPIDDTMTHAQRLFEIDIVHESYGIDTNCLTDVPLSLHRHGAAHEALIIVPHDTREVLRQLSSELPIERVFPAVVAEGMALARALDGVSLRTVLAVGRRDSAWETFTVSDGGALTHWGDHSLDEGSDLVAQIVDVAVSTASSLSTAVDTVVLYGDDLTKSMLDDVERTAESYRWQARRLQPFSSVRTTLGTEDRLMLMRVAHMLGPIVGLVHCTPLSIDIPCALPAAH